MCGLKKKKRLSSEEAAGQLRDRVGFGMMLRRQEGTKQRPLQSMPSVLKECCNVLFFSKFDENHRIMKLKMIKIHFFFWPDSKYKFFQPFTLFSTSLLCFPLELIKKKKKRTDSNRSSGQQMVGWGVSDKLWPPPAAQAWSPAASARTGGLCSYQARQWSEQGPLVVGGVL